MKRHDIEQGSQEWFELRAGIPTVSEFHRIITPKTGKLSTQSRGYIARLIVESVQGPGEGVGSFWMDRGIVLEDEARSAYEFETDQDCTQTGIIINDGFGWSPDGLIGDSGAIEIKVPKPETHVKWLLEGGLPDEHRAQCHGALLVGELDWIDFYSYCPGFRALRIRVEPDSYTDRVMQAMTEFETQLAAAKAKIL